MPGGLASFWGHTPNASLSRPFGPRPIGYNDSQPIVRRVGVLPNRLEPHPAARAAVRHA
jgi:hypothetical protein